MFSWGIILLVLSLMMAVFGSNNPFPAPVGAAKVSYALGLFLFIPGLIRKRRHPS